MSLQRTGGRARSCYCQCAGTNVKANFVVTRQSRDKLGRRSDFSRLDGHKTHHRRCQRHPNDAGVPAP
ncbi:hypothetical protein EMIT0158MI4_30517 [Burkholderia ambifaria]